MLFLVHYYFRDMDNGYVARLLIQCHFNDPSLQQFNVCTAQLQIGLMRNMTTFFIYQGADYA